MKNILLLKGSGVYDAIRNYVDELAMGFRKLGYNTIILDFEKSNLGERLEWILDTYPLYAVLIVNNAIDKLRKRIELPGTVCVNFYCDHPMYHAGELQRLGEDWLVLNLDRRHTAYLKKYFPRFKHAAFMPLSGIPSDSICPYEERKIDVLFTGSYHVPDSMLNIPGEGEDFARMIYLAVWKQLIQTPHMTLDEALAVVFAGYEVVVDDDTFHKVVVELKSIEGGIRCYFREQLIACLLKAGIRVDVFGDGWEKLACEGKENLVIHKGGSQAARRALGDTKIALNIMPWFKDGIQERVIAGMLSGAVALTDTSSYIEEEFVDGEDIVLYHLERIGEAAEKVRWLLEHEKEAERIAKAGMLRAQAKHTWEERAAQIAGMMEDIQSSAMNEGSGRGEGSGVGKALEVYPETESLSYYLQDIEAAFREKTDVLRDLWRNGYLKKDDVEEIFAQFRDWSEYVEKKRGYGLLGEEDFTLFYRRICGVLEEVIQKHVDMDVLENLLGQMWEELMNTDKICETQNRIVNHGGKKMLHIVLVGVGEESVEIVRQALDDKRQEVMIDAVIFDEDGLGGEVFENHPVKQMEDLPKMAFDKLFVCADERIVYDAVSMFRDTLKLPEDKCEAYVRYKIGAHKLNWDVIKTTIDLREQIIQSGTMNDLEKFFYCKEHRVLTKWLHYFEVYDRHFSKYRNKAPVVMEIGVFKGGSLQMWKDYFGEGTQIIGVDIDESTKAFEEEQISVEIGSQEDREFLRSLKEKYPRVDVFIDDGGHTMTQQITTFEEMFPHISYGGTYLCEDLHSSYMKRFGGSYRNPDSYIEYSKNFIDYIHAWLSEEVELQPNQYSRTMHSLHYYDSMLVIEKEKMGAPLTLKI